MTEIQSMRARLTKGTIWIASARMCTNLMGLVSTLVLARILVPADFGLVAFGTTILSVVSAVTNMSLTSALIQHSDPTPEHFQTAWTLNAGRGFIIAVLFCIAAVPAAHFTHEPRLVALMLALSVSPILEGLQNPRTAILTKSLIFWQQFLLQVGSKLAGVIVSLGLAVTFKTYWAIVAGALVGQLVGLIISFSVLPFRPRASLMHYRDLFSFSLWLTLGDLVLTLNRKLDNLLIGGFLGRASLGVYTVGDNLATLPTREAMAPLMGTVFPALSRLVGDRGRLASGYQAAQTMVTAIALPAGVGLALIADPLIRLTMGDKWHAAIIVVQILSATYAIQTLGMLAQAIAMASGDTRLLFKRDLQGFAVSVPFIVIGMYFYGLVGILYARIITAGFGILINMQVVKQVSQLSLRVQLAANSRTFIATAVMALLVALAEHISPAGSDWGSLVSKMAIAIVVGVAGYVGTLAVLWTAMGRPRGPEGEVLAILGRLRQRPSPA